MSSLLALLLSAVAHAGPGPGLWTGRTPVGGLGPSATTEIRLVHETLELRITGLDAYEARAVYQLHNPGPAEVIRWSVPITSGGAGGSARDSAEAASVRVLSEGVFIPCLAADGPRLLVPVPGTEANVADKVCAADVTIPTGASELRLSFEGALHFEASSAVGAVLGGGVDRTLVYGLFPGAGWSKKPDSVEITLDPGPYAGRLEPILPPRPTSEGRLLAWDLQKPDLAREPWVVVKLKVADRDLHARIAGWNAGPQDPARPSSTATRTSDGDGASAWCGPPGQPATLDLSWSRPAALPRGWGPRCALALGALPGDTSSAAAWDASVRPVRVRASMCGADPQSAANLGLAPGRSWDATGAVVPLPDGLRVSWWAAMTDAQAPPPCVRLEAEAGSCFGELAWIVSCP